MPAGFPAIVPGTFPPQQEPAVPLTPFFEIVNVRLPPELTDGGNPAPPREVRVGHENEESAGSTTVTAALDDLRRADNDESLSHMPSSEQSAELLSLAGGSFAAALTPPPSARVEAPPPEPTLSGVNTLGPPPWESGTPPPVPAGPPPLRAPAPPPVPPKPTEQDFAAALGLPVLQDVAPVPREASSTVAEEAAEEERTLAKKGKRTTLIAVAVALVAGVAIALIVARELTKHTEVVPEPASQEVAALPASAPVEVKKDAPAPTNPAKRAEAIEHYNKGNKLYLQRKYPDALNEYKRALESDSTFAYAHRGLGVTYASQGKNEKAIDAYKTYLQLAPDAKDAKQVKQIIANSEK